MLLGLERAAVARREPLHSSLPRLPFPGAAADEDGALAAGTMSEATRSLLQRWGASFRKGTDFDSWGQLVEAIDEYQM